MNAVDVCIAAECIEPGSTLTGTCLVVATSSSDRRLRTTFAVVSDRGTLELVTVPRYEGIFARELRS